MTKDFCDLCGEEVKHIKGSPKPEVGAKLGRWVLQIKVWHKSNDSMSHTICEPCMKKLMDAMENAWIGRQHVRIDG